MAIEQYDQVFLRTTLKKEQYDRFVAFAKTFASGFRNRTGEHPWDFGVALQILMDFYDQNKYQAHINVVSAKVDMVLTMLSQIEQEETLTERVENKDIEMLGGSRVSVPKER